MDKPWNTIVEDVQGYITAGVSVLPAVYHGFLEALMKKEREKQLCLLPSARFQLYHLRLYTKLTTRHSTNRHKAA